MNILDRIKGTSFLCSLTLAAATLAPSLTTAGQINLQSLDGAVDITGEFLGMEADKFVVRTALGELRIATDRVRCTGLACPNYEKRQADVSFSGSETIGVGVMPLLIEGYAAELEAENIVETIDTGSALNGSEVVASLVDESGFGDEVASYRVFSTNTVQGFKGLLDGSTDFAMASRRISPAEAASFEAVGAGDMYSPDQENIVGFDSLIVITNPNNPVDSISMEDLAAVFVGRIRNWSELGGPDMPIRVVARQSDAGTRAIFADNVYDGINLVLGNAGIAVNSTEMADFVTEHEGAIGYTGLAFQRGTKALDIVNECGITTSPDAFSVRTQEYALQRHMYLYNRADLSSKSAQDFLNYALSSKADPVLNKAGFIDFSVARRSQDIDSARAAQLISAELPARERPAVEAMLKDMRNFDQLSTTFRFRTGSSRLDERAIIDMERLTSYLETQPRGTKVVLAGFTDNVGTFANNRRLAGGRAEKVRNALIDFAGDRIKDLDLDVAAYGELSPTACNVSGTGRAINRRVEVWIQADKGQPAT